MRSDRFIIYYIRLIKVEVDPRICMVNRYILDSERNSELNIYRRVENEISNKEIFMHET